MGARRYLDEAGRSGGTSWANPPWINRINEVEYVHGLVAKDHFGDQAAYSLGFRYVGGGEPDEHVLSILIDYTLHMINDLYPRPSLEILKILESENPDDAYGTFSPDRDFATCHHPTCRLG